ncbi:GNAT family N-acetyltransferase [Terricaulis sp.]|uniref:GNAT family N-acetyltransferase n=1 Tax=Terricaulis sp. TaxID=2768686 RepID=UPI003782D8D8
MRFTIRDVRNDDRPGWEHLWAGYLDFYQAKMEPVTIEVTWSRLLDANEPMFCLVAEDDATHELVGLVHCVIHRGTWSVGDFCYLEDLFTAAPARGHGVGRALIEAVYKRADDLELSRVYWLTHETNTTARKLYDQVAENKGFIQYRRRD